jgi:hypothetical protein
MLSDDESPTMLQDQHQQGAQHSSSTSLSSPLLSFMSSSSLPPSLSSSSSVTSPSFLPDLKPLKKAASFKALDSSKQICQYELPGGGVCRDEGCQDVHLSRGDDIEPSGTWFLCSGCSYVLAFGLAYANFVFPFQLSCAARCVSIPPFFGWFSATF